MAAKILLDPALHDMFFCLTCSAGLGVLNMAVQAVSKMSGCSETEAKSQFFLLDKDVCFHSLLVQLHY